jgi:nitrous oxide reductase accessory protein NosL
MKSILLGLALVAFVLLSGCGASSSENTHDDATHVQAICQHCGMPVADYPKWRTQRSNNTGTLHFCSPRCLFMNLGQSDSVPASDAIRVKEYYRLQVIDARTAWYVINSDVMGPMGHDLVPLGSEEEAKEFMEDHKGGGIVRFEEINPALIKSLGKNK